MPATMKKQSLILLRFLSLILFFLVACGPKGSGPSERNPTQAGSPGGGQVVITGAISKTYTPKEISAVKIGEYVGINVNEESSCGVSLQFPINAVPGSYPMADPILQPTNMVFADYGTFCGETETISGNTYRSTSGTLTLTSSAPKYAGNFEFTAANLKDPTKTIKVSGSFQDASLP